MILVWRGGKTFLLDGRGIMNNKLPRVNYGWVSKICDKVTVTGEDCFLFMKNLNHPILEFLNDNNVVLPSFEKIGNK